MGKVFGYPEFDANGEKILTTYDNEYKDMMMDIRVYRMKAGETRSFKRDGEELAVLLLSGNITYAWDGNKETQQKRCIYRRPLVRSCVYRNRSQRNCRGRFRDFSTVYKE